MTVVVPSMLIERFLDAVWLAAGFGIAAMFVPLPRNLVHAGDVLGAIVLVAAAVFVWLVVRREEELEHESAAAKKWSGVKGFISELSAGLRDIGSSRNLYGAAFLSAGRLAC